MKIFKEIPTELPNTPLLDSVDYPSDLRSFSINELETLASELREFLLYSVGQSGGHLGRTWCYRAYNNTSSSL